MTKTDKVIGWLGILACSFELGKTIQDVRINRLKAKLTKQKAERELLEAEAERLEEEFRHRQVMLDLLEKSARDREEQCNKVKADLEELNGRLERIVERREKDMKEIMNIEAQE